VLPLEEGQLHREVSRLISVVSCEGTHRSGCMICARRQWERWNGSTIPFADGSRLIHRFLQAGSGQECADPAPEVIGGTGYPLSPTSAVFFVNG
jgi:hypothetical protein